MMKQTLFTNWHLVRWLRLILGIFLAMQAFENHDALSGFIAAFFLYQAFTNTGCCGINNCSARVKENEKDKIEELVFEEIKVNNK